MEKTRMNEVLVVDWLETEEVDVEALEAEEVEVEKLKAEELEAVEVEEIVSEPNIFSEPWEDSDAVLVVEDQKFHVHRVMLSMASPVFKAMFSSNFKEKDAADIELPGKKESEMLDLLKLVYPQEQIYITIDNVEHIMKLADEYQMRGTVLLPCEKFLLAEAKSKKANTMKILLLAQQYKMTSVRESCYEELRGLKFGEMQELEGFKELDGDSLHELLVPRTKKLETLLEDVYPQLAGLLDFAMYLYQETGRAIQKCPYHYYTHNMASRNGSMQQRLQECLACREMLKTIATGTCSEFMYSEKKYPQYSQYQNTFNKNVLDVLQEMITTLQINS